MSTNNHNRCAWVDLSKPDYLHYHDHEWGVPVFDDAKMFEFIILESAQAGLSWYTILKRRQGYKSAFAQFDVDQVAQFSDAHIEALVNNEQIIRNRGKINAAVNNAKLFKDIQNEYGSFCDYLWQYVNYQPVVHQIKTTQDYLATNEISDAISKDLKKRGFKFFGSTICYAHLQACGLINDHSDNCFRKQQIIDSYQDCPYFNR